MTTAIVLAAGSSRRLGRPKQLLTLDGETLVARATRIAREAVGKVLVVIPSWGDGPGWPDDAQTLVNDHAEEGVASSIRLGVSACDDDVLLVLCDQPRITAAHLRALAEAGTPIAGTAYAGIVGVPAYFSRIYRNELLALRGDAGARRIIEAHREVVATIRFEDAGIDIDTETDARNL